jgi:hypothetical protein
MSTKYINYTSPKGSAKYPKLDQPYSWSQTQNRSVPDADGQYELVLIMPAADFKPLKALLDEAIEQSGIKPQNVPYKKEMDKDTGEATGNVEVKFKAYGKRKDGSKNTVKFFDAKARPMPSNYALTSGSVVKAEGWISVAKMGARLNLRGVQVISLADRGSAFAAEDGYEYEGDDEETNNNNETAQVTNDKDFDF